MLKNLLSLIFLMVLALGIQAQDFNDDFESYQDGDYVGNVSATWTTWSGATGGAEDAQVVTTKAKSGSNSLYFYGTGTGGGPQDVVLPFGAKHTSGVFTLGYSIYVPSGSEAYMNLQGEQVIGTTWSSNWYFRDGGLLAVDAGEAATTSYKQDAWTDVEFIVDLNNQSWSININGECVGTMTNTLGVASLDIFPLSSTTGLSEFWIDDVYYTFEDITTDYDTEAVLSSAQSSGVGISGQTKPVLGKITNKGMTTINEVTLTGLVNGVTPITEELDDLNLAPGESMTFEIEDVVSISNGGNEVVIGITKVNGDELDDNPCTNLAKFIVTGVTPADNKRVLVEEATGTWCQWCPRGTVFMDRMQEAFGDYFVGVAVHNKDPMTDPVYDGWMGSFPGFDGWPNAVVDRTTLLDPSALEASIINQLQISVKSTFDVKATLDEQTNEVVVTVKLNAVKEIPSNHRLWVVIKEDHVTGNDAGYSQVNAFANNAAGQMGGYENLPNPVPFTDMVYDHVGRALLPDDVGLKLPETLEVGETGYYEFGFTLDDSWNTDNIEIVTFLTNQFKRTDNSFEISWDDALANSVDNKNVNYSQKFDIYPNPSTGNSNLDFELESPSNVVVTVYSVTGQQVLSRDYGQLQGRQIIPLDQVDLENGVYNVVLSSNGQIINKKLVIQN